MALIYLIIHSFCGKHTTVLTSPAAYMGTITGCFLLPVKISPSLSCSHLFCCLLPEKRFKEIISSSISRTGMEGKQTSNIRSRRLSNVV
uniref:Uncharacterized protein n=1 Tax=Gopherus evgoodei TaxID=1825980 RepID=A0A8C4VTH4_9SAUR